MPRRRYTEQQFRAALADPDVRTVADLCRALGLVPRGANYESLKRYGVSLGADMSRFEARRARRWSIDAEALESAVQRSTSFAGVLRALDLPRTGSMHNRIKREVLAAGLSTDHFLSRGWARGRTFPERRARIEKHLRADHAVSSMWLRGRLVDEGLLQARCASCQREHWGTQPIPLELDHIDGDRMNNQLDNLRLLCPNCHALTPTYRGRNIGRGNGSGGRRDGDTS